MANEARSIELINPYHEKLRWYRGNLHSHTTFSDGARPPEAVISDYERRGYDFLSISDHDILVDVEDYRRSTTMTLIPGVEVTANGPHLLHVNVDKIVPPHNDRQQVLDEIAAQPESFSILNHPSWLAPLPDLHYSTDHMLALKGYAGIEIYNGVIERLHGAALATDRWDYLLSNGLRVWGYGHDDSHEGRDVALAWNVVQSPDQSIDNIVAGLREGRFYVSTGIDIQQVWTVDRKVSVITSNATRIRFLSKWGVILSTVDSQAAEYHIPDDPSEAASLGYIRVECYGGGSAQAWTQPIWVNVEQI